MDIHTIISGGEIEMLLTKPKDQKPKTKNEIIK
jgi:hypothetical protein